MSTCRYSPGVDCYGAGTLTIASCDDRCAGPVDLSPGKSDREAKKHGLAGLMSQADKQLKPAVLEEVKTVLKGERSQEGECQQCHAAGQKINPCKHYPGKLVCRRCSKAAMNRAYSAKTRGKESATKAPVTERVADAAASKPKAKISASAPPPATSGPGPGGPLRSTHQVDRPARLLAPDPGRNNRAGVDGSAALGAVDGGC